MIRDWLQHLVGTPSSGKGFALLIEIALVGLLGGVLWILMRSKSADHESSGFRVREADLPSNKKADHANARNLADAKMAPRKSILALPGIRIGGAAYQVLGISEDAGIREIQQAYRELMKQYHPDRIARPGTSQWQDAQNIAEAINKARDEMLDRAKRKGRV